jgi:TPP-dependent 2-oxoacid decarboxylase
MRVLFVDFYMNFLSCFFHVKKCLNIGKKNSRLIQKFSKKINLNDLIEKITEKLLSKILIKISKEMKEKEIKFQQQFLNEFFWSKSRDHLNFVC